MTATQNPAQDVSDDLSRAYSVLHSLLQRSWKEVYIGTKKYQLTLTVTPEHMERINAAMDVRARELQQPLASGDAEAVPCHLCDGGVKRSHTGSVWCEACNRTGYRTAPPVVDAHELQQAQELGEAMREAWCDWYDEYLTDGNGHAPVKTGEACHAAFVAAYPGGLKAAREAALTAWNKLHPQSSRACGGRWAVTPRCWSG